MSLRIEPMFRDPANDFVRRHHRHSKPVKAGYLFAQAAVDRTHPTGIVRGVQISGRPVSRELDDGYTIEILRNCTDGARNACSMLYGAACRAASALGYQLAITYTLASEGGASLRAAGFTAVAEVKDRQWGCAARPREERDLVGDKVRWERRL